MHYGGELRDRSDTQSNCFTAGVNSFYYHSCHSGVPESSRRNFGPAKYLDDNTAPERIVPDGGINYRPRAQPSLFLNDGI